MSDQKIFVEGFGNIAIRDGVVRIGLVDTMPGKDGKLSVKRVGGLAMSVPAFLSGFQQMKKVVDRLEEQGAIKRKDVQATEPVQ
jgi:hypothetical protein